MRLMVAVLLLAVACAEDEAPTDTHDCIIDTGIDHTVCEPIEGLPPGYSGESCHTINSCALCSPVVDGGCYYGGLLRQCGTDIEACETW